VEDTNAEAELGGGQPQVSIHRQSRKAHIGPVDVIKRGRLPVRSGTNRHVAFRIAL
jgi:hypothetical protein